MNGDGSLTITDLGMWLQHTFFLPGDWLIWAMLVYAPGVSRFLELSEADYGSTVAALFSVLSWLCVTCVVLTTTHYIGEFDRALTRAIVSVFSRLRLKSRIWAGLLKARMFPADDDRARIELPLETEVSAAELAVLKAHAKSGARDAMELDDVVGLTALPREEVDEILGRLEDLELLDRQQTVKGAKRTSTLTRPGRAFLYFRNPSIG